MINKTQTQKMQTVEEVQSMICDVCKKEYKPDDIFELQEFHHIRFTGGYGSVFGDEADVECDICQHCLLKMIGEYARIE
jgi:hypothetical protein